MRRVVIIFCAITGFLYLESCNKNDPEPSGQDKIKTIVGCDGDVNGTDCQYFSVPKDCTIYTTGTELIAEKGIAINGNLIIKTDEPGDFKLTALTGDIVINGSIAFDSTAQANGSGRKASVKDGAHGRSIVIEAAEGNLNLEANARITTENGSPGEDLVLGTIAFPENVLNGNVNAPIGGNGGNIELNAPKGSITFPPISDLDGSILFDIGNGGAGGSIEVGDDFNVVETVRFLNLFGGKGGNSGKIILNAQKIQGKWSSDELEGIDKFFITGGFAGNGGNVQWILTRIAPTQLSLDVIALVGGFGGDGIIYGGSGGYAACYINRVINKIGMPVTGSFVHGGFGGDVMGTGLPMHTVKGGDGGAFMVVGAHGWNGGKDPDSNIVYKDGADGGSVDALGGTGGRVLSEVDALYAVGGDGGLTENHQSNFVDLLKQLNSNEPWSDEDFTAPLFGVIAGSGGDGESACFADGKGGNGGKPGEVFSLYPGPGGTVQNNNILHKKDGEAGNIWSYGAFRNGNGGNGNPPGVGADEELVSDVELGQVLGTVVQPIKGEDGVDCTLSCDVGGIQTGSSVITHVTCNGTNTSTYYATRRILGATNELISATVESQNISGTWNKGDGDFPPGWTASTISDLNRPFQVLCDNDGNVYVPGEGIYKHTDIGPTCPNDPSITQSITLMMDATGCFAQYRGKECDNCSGSGPICN